MLIQIKCSVRDSIVYYSQAMCLLLVFVLLFSSSAYFSASSHQYYVSDNCSSVTYTPCRNTSVFAGDMSQYNNTIFYLIEKSYHDVYIEMNAVENITLQGLNQSSFFDTTIIITNSIHVKLSNLTLALASVLSAQDSNNITIAGCFLEEAGFFNTFHNVFNLQVTSSILVVDTDLITFHYTTPSVCYNKLHHYSLTISNVTFLLQQVPVLATINLSQGTAYNLSIVIDHTNFPAIQLNLHGSLFNLIVNKCDVSSIYLVMSEESSKRCDIQNVQLSSTLVIKDSKINSRNEYSAGLVIIGKYSGIDRSVTNCTIIIDSCSIHDNDYGILIVGTFLSSTNISIMNTELAGNRRNELIGCHNILLSNVTITNSLSSGLILEGSVVIVNNSLILKNNTGIVGGGMVLNGSVILLAPQASLQFIDNHASYKGGGIYIDTSLLSLNCPFQKLSMPAVPFTLKNNTAGIAGGDMYGLLWLSCDIDDTFHFKNQNISYSNNAYKMCVCNPDKADKCFTGDIPHQYVFPGQAVKFKVTYYGQAFYSNGKCPITDGIVWIYLDGVLVNHTYITSKCSLVEYTPNQQTYGRHVIKLSINSVVYAHSGGFTLYKCPIGFSIDSSQGVCSCSQNVLRENVICDIASLNITHNGLQWIGTYDTSTPFNANQTNPNACIINEDCLLYCSPNPVTFKMNDTDPQCVDDRGQRMCGSCRDGYSLLMGSNECGHCDNDYMMIAWIALFAVMGLLMVVLLIALNLTVSVGTLNGLLFYANIVKLYGPVFSRKRALPVLSQVISWINLDFGIETCFYNGMDSYVKQWLQFAFPLYLWGIIILIIWLCRRYGKISRLMGSHAVPVLSTLFLLSYTKLVRTIVIVLHKREVTLHCTNESMRSVSLWYEDPNVEYAKGKHAGLFGFAFFVSVFFILPYTLFLLFDPLFEKYLSNYKVFKKLWSKIKPIIDAYSGPMKDEYRFWPGLLLVARLPILLSVTLVDSFIQSHYFLLSMLLTVLAIVLSIGYCFDGVYRKRMNTIIEIWFLFNLCIMVGLSVAYNDDSAVLIWYNTCLCVFIASFIAIIVYHLYLQLSHMKCYDALMKKLFKKQDDDDDESLLDVTETHKTVDQQTREIKPSSTDVRLSRRESVVELY